MTYNVLTGRKELFDGAPPSAMVVLETNDAEPRILYAVDHDMGANYWEADGTPGRPIGLIALFKKTRVVARRTLTGAAPAPSVPPVVSASGRKAVTERAQRILDKRSTHTKAQDAAKPASAPVKPATTAPDMGNLLEQIAERDARNGNKPLRVPEPGELTKAATDGFVSLFAIGKSRGLGPQGKFMTIHTSGNLTLSAELLAAGDVVDIQIDPATRIIRIGKAANGRTLGKSKTIGSVALLDYVKFPDGKKSARINVTEVNGWWQGELPK